MISQSPTITAQFEEFIESCSAVDADPALLMCDRHPASATAFTFVEADGLESDLSFGELRIRSQRFAGLLSELGVRRGDRVASLMGKSADLVTSLVGIWRVGAVYVPLFTAFATDAISERLIAADIKIVVADADQAAKVPDGPWTLLVAGSENLNGRLAAAALFEASTPVGGDGALVHMFTSGTTGPPKGVIQPVRYLAGWQAYVRFTLGVCDESVYWCGADPGWAYGLYAAIVAPMVLGLRSVVQRGGFNAAATWRTLRELGVTDYAAAPTVFRALRASGTVTSKGLKLQRVSSAGEPLTPDVNEWANRALGLQIHDHYGQTELGMVTGFPHHPDLRVPVADQSMGIPLPGWTVAVLEEETDSPTPSGTSGRLAVDIKASVAMTFTGYAGSTQSDRFTADGRYYLTGDLAVLRSDGILEFSSREDDVIIMAGYRIGPFDVESVLAQHPAIAECAVVAAPDPVRGEVIEAFVVLREDAKPTKDFEHEIQNHVRERYAAHAYPRRVHIVPGLPKTASGKIQRSQLRHVLREAAPNPALVRDPR